MEGINKNGSSRYLMADGQHLNTNLPLISNKIYHDCLKVGGWTPSLPGGDDVLNISGEVPVCSNITQDKGMT